MGRVIAGRYEIESELGHGVYGEVFRAYDHNLSKTVALKLFKRGTPPSQAFIEARFLIALEGKYILRALNADVYQDVRYMVTEVAPGGSVEKSITPFGVPTATAVRWVSDLLLGLDVVHHQGILHRDVKPGNLFLSDEGHAQLGDFGVAEFLRDNSAPADGDPRIRAPEMFDTGQGSVHSDVYSAGVTLYAVLSGSYPFDGTFAEISAAATSGRYPDIRDVAPHVSQRLAARVRRAMNLNPALRYESARAMHEALGGPRPRYTWGMRVPHPHHERCWGGVTHRGTPALAVCLIPSGDTQYDIETRRETGARTRIQAHCHSALSPARVGVLLRRIFGAL
jgi:serine/threonine protein kinase